VSRIWYLSAHLSALLVFSFAHAAAVHAADAAHGDQAVLTDGVSSMTLEAAATAILGLPPELRERMAGDRKSLARTIGNALVDSRVEAAARAAGVPDLPEVKATVAKNTQLFIVRKYLEDEVRKLAAAAPDFTSRAREIYAVSQAAYARREAIQAAHILFAVNPENENVSEADVRAKAARVLLELKDGADFAAKAKEHSEDKKSGANGGMLNWTERGTLVPPFEKAAYALKPGEISDLVRTRFGYHIIKLIKHRPPATATFEEVKEQIIAKLKEEYMSQKRGEFLARFAGTRDVEIDDRVMEALRRK